MKFSCEKGILQKEVLIAQEIIGTKSSISALSNIFMETEDNSLVIKATNMSVFFETKVPVSVDIAGKTNVRGSRLLDCLDSIPEGELSFEKSNSKGIIKSADGKTTSRLVANSLDQYPEQPSYENANSFEMPISDFKSMITQTIFAVSDDEMRYLMNGVYFENFEGKYIMVATDGKRLAYAEKPAAEGSGSFSGIIIPEKILSIISRHSGSEGNVKIKITEKNIFISFGLYNFSSALIEGQYPNYRRVIPENLSKSFTLSRSRLLDALKRVAKFVEKNKRVFIRLSNEGIFILAQDSEEGDSNTQIEDDYSGDDLQIAFNYRYLEEPLKVMESDSVVINFNDPSKAITIKPVPENYFFHVVMPMQID